MGLGRAPGGRGEASSSARELVARYGKHFLPPASLLKKAEKGELLK